MSTTYMTDQITANPKQCGNKSCIRSMRIRGINVIYVLANKLISEDK